MKIAHALIAAIVMLLSVALLAQEGRPKDPERLAKARKIYLKGVAKINEERDQRLKSFTVRYIKELEKIQVAYTKKGNLDAALSVRNEIAGLEPLVAKTPEPLEAKKPEEKKPEVKRLKLRGIEEKLGHKLGKHPKDAKRYHGNYYKYFPGRISWTEAQARCKKLGGYLACIKDMRELEFVWKLADKQDCWLGASDAAEEGKWAWLDGTELDRKNFGGVLSLDNKRGNQNWLSLLTVRGNMKLNDHWLNSSDK